ncbi:MAG: hypothetical protein ACEY3F_01900 [Wolbachia sp.]
MSGHWDDTPLVAQTTTFVQLWNESRYDGSQRYDIGKPAL